MSKSIQYRVVGCLAAIALVLPLFGGISGAQAVSPHAASASAPSSNVNLSVGLKSALRNPQVLGLRPIQALLSLAQPYQAQQVQQVQQGTFGHASFQKVWERTDKLVASGQVKRSWYWGPTPGATMMEDYAEGQGGKRLVQYFDKSRMEVNNPNGNPNDPFFITNGLLTVELISGK